MYRSWPALSQSRLADKEHKQWAARHIQLHFIAVTVTNLQQFHLHLGPQQSDLRLLQPSDVDIESNFAYMSLVR